MNASQPAALPFFWIDLEMTGLDEKKDQILEVAVILTDPKDPEFRELATYHRVVFQPPAVLEGMNDWCKKTHGESGLTAEVPHGTPLSQVENELLSLIDAHYGPEDRVVLCGNSVGNDRRFVDAYFPRVARRLHYRLIDVSSFKEVYRTRYGLIFNKPDGRHRALEDIRESIRELRFYLSYLDGNKLASAPPAQSPSKR